VGVELIICVE